MPTACILTPKFVAHFHPDYPPLHSYISEIKARYNEYPLLCVEKAVQLEHDDYALPLAMRCHRIHLLH